jgi:hypothetical protein
MSKASIDKPDGTKITIDGTPEEVARILQLVEESPSARVRERPKTDATKKSKTGLKSLILELKDEGFFKERRLKADVKDALESRGHYYPDSSLGTRLLELVRDDKELGRLKEGNKWVYVHRN